MWSPVVSPWFASLPFLFLHLFPPGNYADLEVARDGTVWVLIEGRPELYIVPPSGEPSRFLLDDLQRPAGLCLDGTGGCLVSDAAGTITVFDRFIRPLSTTAVSGTPGDLVLSGMSVWFIETERGEVLNTDGLVVSRDAPSRGRLFFRRGEGILSGRGVYRIREGEVPVMLSPAGDGCPYGDGVLLLRDSVLYGAEGDTLFHPVLHERVSAQPGGGIIVLWGGGHFPLVVE
ncbi:MAG: hypothetical protein R6V62_01735 [Candidatus Fermentibacteraceae bacterium]